MVKNNDINDELILLIKKLKLIVIVIVIMIVILVPDFTIPPLRKRQQENESIDASTSGVKYGDAISCLDIAIMMMMIMKMIKIIIFISSLLL